MIIKSYRKKPVVIQAVQWDGVNAAGVRTFMSTSDRDCTFTRDRLIIHTHEGAMEAQPGDYIIRGVKGEFYPCKPDIFTATYEEVE